MFNSKKISILVCLLGLLIPITGKSDEMTPEAVKASYILNLRPFVTLGNPAHIAETVCYYERPGVPANESVGQILTKYNEAKPDKRGHPMVVKWIKAIRDFGGCDILYIPQDEISSLPSIITTLGNSATLTISSLPQYIYKGGMIGFVADDTNRIKMEANIKNSLEKNVFIASEILEIMQQVIR